MVPFWERGPRRERERENWVLSTDEKLNKFTNSEKGKDHFVKKSFSVTKVLYKGGYPNRNQAFI